MKHTGKTQLQKFGDSVRRARKELEISQEVFAEWTDLHRTYIGQVERREKNISFVNILKIAKAIKILPSELFKSSKLYGLLNLVNKSLNRGDGACLINRA